MITRFHLTRASAVVTLCLAGSAGAAHADIISALVGTPTAVSGGFAYTYSVELTGQQQLDPATGGTVSFGTVYDFGPIIGSLTSTGILATSFNFTLADTNAPANQTVPFDSPLLTNIRFTYTGSSEYYVNNTTAPAGAVQLPSTPDNLGTFTVVSPTNDLDHNVQYDGQAEKATNDTISGNVGYTSGPNAAELVPEPASLLLLGAGVLSAGLLRRRVRQRVARHPNR